MPLVDPTRHLEITSLALVAIRSHDYTITFIYYFSIHYKGEEANQPASATKKMIKGKNTMQDIDGQLNFLGKSMMALVESKPENPQLDDTQKDWYSYAANFGIRAAAIPCDDAPDQIRLGMENLYATYKKWKPSV